MASSELKEIRRREGWLAELLTQSREQRRRRGIRVERYRIELELGAVQHAIELFEAEELAAQAIS